MYILRITLYIYGLLFVRRELLEIRYLLLANHLTSHSFLAARSAASSISAIQSTVTTTRGAALAMAAGPHGTSVSQLIAAGLTVPSPLLGAGYATVLSPPCSIANTRQQTPRPPPPAVATIPNTAAFHRQLSASGV